MMLVRFFIIIETPCVKNKNLTLGNAENLYYWKYPISR